MAGQERFIMKDGVLVHIRKHAKNSGRRVYVAEAMKGRAHPFDRIAIGSSVASAVRKVVNL